MIWATPIHQTFDTSPHRGLSASSLSSFSPRNLRGWRNLISWGNLWKGKVSGRLVDEPCLVYRYGCWHRSKLSVSNADRRCTHLFGLRGILMHVAQREDLSGFFLSVFILSLKDIFSRDLSYVSVSGGWLPFFALREEDEYSELRSELSQSQHEVNEDSRSVDQDQTSVSIPENQSTMVTADMGESACHYRKAGVRFLDCNRNFRNIRQPELKFN